LEEARQAQEEAGSMKAPFNVGRAEALTESLHTWANQLKTFGLEPRLGAIWDELRAYLAERGLEVDD
jgi:hypothetical protein